MAISWRGIKIVTAEDINELLSESAMGNFEAMELKQILIDLTKDATIFLMYNEETKGFFAVERNKLMPWSFAL